MIALAVVVAGLVQVESNGACPGAAEVSAHLATLLPGRQDGASDRALVAREGGVVRLELRLGDGSMVVARELAARGSCAELARAVAVMIAVWQEQHHPGLTPAPSLVSPPPPRVARISLEATPELGASLAGADLVAGAAITAGFWGRAVGLVLSASGTALHDRRLGRARAGWTRWAIGLGPGRRLARGNLRADLRAELLAGLVWARGLGYDVDRSAFAITPGVGGAIDLSRTWGRLLFSVGLSAAGWPLEQALVVTPAGDARQTLPRLEARAGAGVGFRFSL